MFTASEIETRTIDLGVSPAAAGLLGGMGGGIAQAYATMGTYFQFRTYLSECVRTRVFRPCRDMDG